MRYGCDYLDNDKDSAWKILTGFEKIEYNLLLLGWTPCESEKAVHIHFYLSCSLLL